MNDSYTYMKLDTEVFSKPSIDTPSISDLPKHKRKKSGNKVKSIKVNLIVYEK